jgi:signal transduction histidine kinase
VTGAAGQTPELFTQLARLLPEPLLLVSLEGVLVACNAAAAALLGQPAASLPGRPLTEWVVDPPEQLLGLLRRAARSLEPLPGALLLQLASGQRVRRSCHGARLEPGGAALVLLRLTPEAGGASTFGLLTQKVEALTREVELRRQREEELRRAQELQEQLIGIVSHDVRSPLSAILMSTRQLQGFALDERSSKVVERIERGGRRVEQVVRLLLDFTQARLGRGIPIHPQPVNLRELCARVADELKATHPARAVEVRGTCAWTEADPERLFQVLVNLVGNAFKYGAPDRPVTMTTRALDDTLQVEVHNEGEPIPESLLPRLFEPFSRGSQTAETIKVSLGLGLYIVKQLMLAHEGTVEVHSTREAGTTFTLRLPRKGLAAEPCPAQAATR